MAAMSAVVTASLLPDPPARRHGEADLQRSVNQFMRWMLPADAIHFAIPNGLMRSKKAAARAIGEGVRAGIPDLCVIHAGRPIFLELKTPKGALSAVQRQMHEKLTYAGAPVFVCRSLPEVEARLRECGVPLRGRVAAA
jgi:hypothetical protein